MSVLSITNLAFRKFVTVTTNPVGVLRSRQRRILQHIAEYRLRRLGYLELFNSRPAIAIKPDYGDLWFLYRQARKRKARTILEFGSGCSTVILAQALADTHRELGGERGTLYSVEADPHWAEVTKASLPVHLRNYCRIIYGPVQEVEYAEIRGFRHTNVPSLTPDFVYLDGPALTAERKVAVDLLDLESQLPPNFLLIVDGRTANVEFLAKHFKRRYSIKRNQALFNTEFSLLY